MIGEQYKIIGVALAETIRHKRDLWTFIERSLRIKKDILRPKRLEVKEKKVFFPTQPWLPVFLVFITRDAYLRYYSYFKTFSKDRINVSGPGQVRVEMCTKILDCLLSR